MAGRDEVTGAFQGPPPGAPHEVTQPLSAETVAAQIAQAQANERELPPFNPQPMAVVPVETPVPPPADLNAAAKLLAEARTRRPESHQPAASNTDSPSRGMPRAVDDPGKAITGGFGSPGEAQYYAINGLELQEVVRKLLDQLNERITNDLRFSIAITYPRISVRLKLEVESHAQNAGVEIVYAKKDERTPLDVAEAHADEVCFVLREVKREFDDDGVPENPPDRMREELGLPVPRKRMIQAGATRVMVDVVPDLDETF